MSAKTGMYPGSFDPVTNGHMDIIRRAARVFGRVIVAVMINPDKQGCFPVEERVAMLEKACKGLENVEIKTSSGLTAEAARAWGADVLVRGVRTVGDLENENAMARINAAIIPGLDTVYFPASGETGHISSTYVRQLASFGADIKEYVPWEILDDIKKHFHQ